MNNFKLVFFFCLFGGLLFSSRDKEEIEARQTASFYTQSASSSSALTVFVEGILAGELPVVSEGIGGCSEKSKGFEKLLNTGVSTIVVKNTDDEVVIDIDLDLKNKGRSISIVTARKGTATSKSFQLGGSETCLIVELIED